MSFRLGSAFDATWAIFDYRHAAALTYARNETSGGRPRWARLCKTHGFALHNESDRVRANRLDRSQKCPD